ncbi:MAG: hypothetical protein JWP97_1294, partial [Labilithrix sp.]|nr:hypothetical protein [Labilithrix sp.]
AASLCAALGVTGSGCSGRRPAATGAPSPASAASAPAEQAPGSSFRVDKGALRRARVDEKGLAKLDASAYRYFRMLARPYEVRTCAAFQDLRWSMPVAAVHGDAHLEQFVVTSDTYGAEDFDQAGFGPAVVDLVRFAASLVLAGRELGWACDTQRVTNKFFDAYRAALDAPPRAHPAPAVVARLRKRTPQGRAAWLDWVGEQMLPLPEETDARARLSWKTFVELQQAVRPDRPAAYFDIVRFGELHMGVGSALEHKYLARVQGPTADPADDIVLEARAGGDTSASGCVWRPDRGDSLHVLRFMATLGPRMPEVFGYVGLADSAASRPFWIQSWSPGYEEIALADITSQHELEEVAESVGRQLAGYFWKNEVQLLRAYHRFSQLHGFDLIRERATRLATDLATETVAAWQEFRAQP